MAVGTVVGGAGQCQSACMWAYASWTAVPQHRAVAAARQRCSQHGPVKPACAAHRRAAAPDLSDVVTKKGYCF